MRRILATAALAAILAAGVAPATVGPASAGPLPQQAASCSGVWVVVDFGSLGGGISSRCATSFGTGSAALRSAGFSPTITEGFVDKISGKPAKPDINKAYWSYWHATRTSNGSYGSWSYSNLGANSYKPTAGNAEGWRYQSLSDGKLPPGSAPPATTSSPKPTPKPSKSSKPSPKPSATKKATASSKPKASTKASATTKASSTAKPSKTAATATASPTSTPSGRAGQPSTQPPTTPPAPAPAEPATAQAQPAPASTPVAADASGSGSPVGLITTVGIVLAGAAGLGGWWWKGRKP